MINQTDMGLAESICIERTDNLPKQQESQSVAFLAIEILKSNLALVKWVFSIILSLVSVFLNAVRLKGGTIRR
jgi:hypothetical protein